MSTRCHHDLRPAPTFSPVQTCARCGLRLWREGADPQMGFPGYEIPLPTEPVALAMALLGGNVPGSWRPADLVPLLEVVAIEGVEEALHAMGRRPAAGVELMRKALLAAFELRRG